MRIIRSEFDGNKIKVRYEDGTTEVLWRKQPGDEKPLVTPVDLVGLDRRCAVYAIQTGFLQTVEKQIESTVQTILRGTRGISR